MALLVPECQTSSVQTARQDISVFFCHLACATLLCQLRKQLPTPTCITRLQRSSFHTGHRNQTHEFPPSSLPLYLFFLSALLVNTVTKRNVLWVSREGGVAEQRSQDYSVCSGWDGLEKGGKVSGSLCLREIRH